MRAGDLALGPLRNAKVSDYVQEEAGRRFQLRFEFD